MLKCEVCGKELKNKAGLGGHKATLHGEHKPHPLIAIRDAYAALEHRLAILEGRTNALASRPMPMLADPGQGVTPQAVGEALISFLEPRYNIDQHGHKQYVITDQEARLRGRLKELLRA